MLNNKERELWELYYPRVFGYFYKRIDNKTDVEDLTSMALSNFLITILDEQRGKRIENQQAYLWKIANNQLCQFIKFKSKLPVVIGLNDNLDSVNLIIERHESLRHKEKVQELNKCLEESVKEQDLEMLKCLLIDDKSSKEVGREFGLKDGNI
jgi:RNA polymerase sigma factor (sigma-70 family)